jgi:hypothetical protein
MYFEVRDAKPSVVLMIVLMHSAAANIEKFIRAVTTAPTPPDDISRPGIPFAFSYMSPFPGSNGRIDPMIKNPWTVWSEPGSLELVGKESTDYQAISLIGKVTSQLMPFESLTPVCVSSDAATFGPRIA